MNVFMGNDSGSAHLVAMLGQQLMFGFDQLVLRSGHLLAPELKSTRMNRFPEESYRKQSRSKLPNLQYRHCR